MQKWEYQVLYVSARMVQSINDEAYEIQNQAMEASHHHSKPPIPPLHSYLTEMGLKGWEVIGIGNEFSKNGTGEETIILKRLIGP